MLQSPLFNTATHPRWREAVKETWTYLTRCYEIQGDNQCVTTIRLHCIPSFQAPQLKRIAQAIIHFEPVLDLFMPDKDGSEIVMKRNWRENPLLGQSNQTQAQSIALIEDIPITGTGGSGPMPQDLVSSIMGHDTVWSETRYLWYLRYRQTDVMTFCKPVVCESAEDAVRWSDLILSFIRAALACPSPTRLQMIAMNHCGLQYFLSAKLRNTSRKRIQGVWWYVDLGSGQRVVRQN
jgi:hypothetical protein